MKKAILLVLLLMGLVPYIENGSLHLGTKVMAQIGEEADPDISVCVGESTFSQTLSDGSVLSEHCTFSSNCVTGEKYDEDCTTTFTPPTDAGDDDPDDPYGGGTGGSTGGGSGNAPTLLIYHNYLPIGLTGHTLSYYQESMQSCDNPAANSLGFDFTEVVNRTTEYGMPYTTTNDLMSFSNSDLKQRVKDLFEWTSMGSMETVALDMLERFYSGNGSPYSNSQLPSIVASSSAFDDWSNNVINTYIQNLRSNGNDVTTAGSFPLQELKFDGLGYNMGGLGITLHSVWETNVYVNNLVYNSSTNTYSGTVTFALKDDFGLDRNDVVSNLNREIPPGASSAFKAWYILQHYRCSKPFETNVIISKSF